MQRSVIFLMSVVAGSIGCRSSEPLAVGVPDGSVSVEFENLVGAYSTFISDFAEPTRRVITNASDFELVWSLVFPDNQLSLPAIDFENETVIVVGTGTRPTGGFVIEVSGVFRDGDQFLAQVTESTPGHDCSVITVITSPVTIVRVSGQVEPLVFVEQVGSVPCTD